MTHTEIIEERGEYRASIVLDESPHEPEFEYGVPVLRLDPLYWGGARVSHTGYGQASSDRDGLEHTAEYVLGRFIDQYGVSDGVDIFERYIRAFHGGQVNVLSLGDSRHYGHVAYTTAAMASHWGTDNLSADVEEYQAWLDGDVFGIVIERKVVDFHEVRGLNGDLIRSEEIETWDEIESVWGYYGERYATESAREQLDYYAPKAAA